MFDRKLLRDTGFLPNEYLYYYYHREKALANMLQTDMPRGKSIEAVNLAMMEELKQMNLDEEPEKGLQTFLYYMQLRENSYMTVETGEAVRPCKERGKLEVPNGMGYAGVMLDCIEGMRSKEGKYLVLSVENKGCIPGFADDDVVETTCLVSERGIEPVPVREVPPDCDLLMKLIKRYEKMTVKAVETGSEETAVLGMMLHPLVNSYSLSKEIFEKYDLAYGGLFKKEV